MEPRLEELILSGEDVNVLNHTTLSLWHFQQLAIELLPSTAAMESEEDQDGVKSPKTVAPAHQSMAARGVELGEGMNVAAVLYEHFVDPLTCAEDAASRIRDTWNGTQDGLVQPMPTIKGQLTRDTRVAAIFQRYRCVLCLDASPSIVSIDPSSGRLFLDLLYESLELFLWSILRPMEVGGVAFVPELHVSVLVQGALVESLCVLLQGYIVTQTNAAGFLQLIKERVQLIENEWAAQTKKRGKWGSMGNATPATLEWIVQNAVFALNSLPTDCAPMMVLVTDGVLDARDVFSYDNLLMQLVRHDIQCNFLRIGGGGEDELNATFGFVPDTHLLQFVAEYTGGTVFDYAAIHEACYGTTSTSSNTVKKMTGLQDAFFLRKSSVHANSAPVVKLNEMDSTSFDGRTLLPLRPYRMWRDKVHEYRIFADVNRIVEARLCEGFSINKIHVKTCRQPRQVERGSVQAGVDSPGIGDASNTSGNSSEVTKILIVFLLQWKQNVWLEYVVSTTTADSATLVSSASLASHSGRRVSGQGFKGPPTSSAAPTKPTGIFYNDQRTAWSEWYVKMNILGFADFLRAFEDTMQRSSASEDRGAAARGENSMASPVFVHDFIRNVQDVDRVLLHLMTATASIDETSDSVTNQFSFGTNLTSASPTPRITSSHPVFNIIGDLSTVLWHRWFYVERFEILSVVKSDTCTDLFYRGEMHDRVGRGTAGSHLRGLGNFAQGMIQNHGANSVYGTNSGHIAIGVESLAEPLVAILVKWSSQKLSQDLFLKFLRPADSNKVHATPRATSPSSIITLSGGIAQRRRQRSHNSSIGEGATCGDGSSSTKESKAALCFVRLEFKNKTLCAIHVAFFATRASTRRQVLNDLKSTIFASINEVAVTPTLTKLLSSSVAETPVILCHRMLSRLLVTHDTLLLHGIDQKAGAFDCYVASPTLEAEKNAGAIPPSSTCCGGSELQLHRVFDAYVWNSSWKWEVSNLAALLDVMRRLHDARISCGFWVLDWKMEEGDDGQSSYVESVIFGREILMENENGNTKTALVQYALRRVSDTCLMTSFWMEPQHGIVKTRLLDDADQHDRSHWKLKQAIGHSTPFENRKSRNLDRTNTPQGASGWVSASSIGSADNERKSIHHKDMSIDWNEDSKYLGESELLHLIRGYLFKSDRHFLSCLYTFDSIINLGEEIGSLNQLSKNINGIVGSNWNMDRQLAAGNGMILPPFSTARLLATSKRSTEHFLMYLQNCESSANGVDESSTGFAPSVSPANESLYSMLELTLSGLSDCEVSWTDYNGDVVAGPSMDPNGHAEDDRSFREDMDGQLPLWLKQHLALTFKDRVPHHALSKGKCYAKLVSDDCVVLAFFPSLDTLQAQSKKGKGELILNNHGKGEGKSPYDDRLGTINVARGKEEGCKKSSQQFSVRSADEGGIKSRAVRMSVSADDIVLYQERRRSFREGYKSWRMGHYQGSRDAKHSYGRDFQKLRLPSTPEDHEFCEEISRQASYGCDFHLLIESANGAISSGFFQVAFYECSLSRLSTDLQDTSSQMLDPADLSHTILRHLFFSKHHDKPREGRSTVPRGRGLWKASSARSPSDSAANRLSSSSIRASHRFRKKIKRAHEHNFSRGVYMALREGGAVQHSDLLQALSSCIEVPVDVDITLLYRMTETAASHKMLPLSPAAAAVVSAGMGADILKDKLTKSFETILSNVFVPIAGTKYYYFSGNENTIYEDLSGSEYDLHILMEDSDDGEAITESRKKEQLPQSDDIDASEEENVSLSIGERNNMAPHHCFEKGSVLNLEAGEDAAEEHSDRGRRNSLGRESPSLVIASTEEKSECDQHHTNVEEDAEFNKDVAVATSSFSVPFFLKFECRLLSSSRETRSSAAHVHALGETTESALLYRSSDGAAYEDMRNDMVPSSRQGKLDAFLESLKTCHGSQSHMNSADASHGVESSFNLPSGRIALRLITLTLPNEQVFHDRRVPPYVPFEMDISSGPSSETNVLPSILHNFSTLHLFQRQVLTRIRKDIKEWSSVEMLSILKSANEITPAIGALVQNLFDDLPELTVTKASYPLEFVAGSQETAIKPLDLFKREFEKGDLLNVYQCNGVYFVIEPTIPTDTVEEGAKDRSGVSFKVPYWAFFEFGADQISLRLHHPDGFLGIAAKEFNRLEVLTRFQLGIHAVCRRVNQFLLLLQLHETRTCNGLLLPPNSKLPSSPRSPKRRNGSQKGASKLMNGKDGRKKRGSFFWPGQFECDLRFSAFFKLHERLAPNVALNILCTSALEQFQVHNRRHIFVYRDRDGHVFYMKISIFYDTTLSHEVDSQLVEERQERSGFTRSSTGGNSGGATISATTTIPGGVPGIRLEVFGISEAGEEVTHELCRLLERKLDEATQVVLMKLLARNTKFQLSQPDLAFLCPPSAKPSSKVHYILPGEIADDCCKLLHYLSQTLKSAAYIRPVASSGSLPSRSLRVLVNNNTLRPDRLGSLASAESDVSLSGDEPAIVTSHDKFEETKLEEVKRTRSMQDSALIHPVCFGGYPETGEYQEESSLSLFDAATRSPVFFFSEREAEGENVAIGEAISGVTPIQTPPDIVACASYVLNLNPDLRLSQGFLSRVGKGLALMRVDFIRKNRAKIEAGDESKEDAEPANTDRIKQMHDIPGLAALYSTRVNTSDNTLVARCQVWIRGSIHSAELRQVVEAFMDEALYDYHIEATIRKLNPCHGRLDTCTSSDPSSDLSRVQGNLPSDVGLLLSLFKSACLLPSSSVTNLEVDVPIAPWDLNSAVAQIRSFFCCLPHHLRPAVYAKSKLSDSYEIVSSRNEGLHMSSYTPGSTPDKFRLIVQHAGDSDAYEDSSDSDAETTASMSSAIHHIEPLMRTDSIHSEISDIDSVSGRVPVTLTSNGAFSVSNAMSQIQTAPSVSSATSSVVGLMGVMSHPPHLPKNVSFLERDVLLYSNKGSTHHRYQKSQTYKGREATRSFYYVADLSSSKGLRLYGYNMSCALVEALTTHISRVLTWSLLRERLLRTLLLEKAGLSTAAPVGSMVLQPSTFFSTIGKMEQAGKGVGKNSGALCKDSAVHFIEYRPTVLSILQSNEWFPRVLDAGCLRSIEGTSLGAYLREAETQSALAALDPQYQRPRGQSSTNLGVSIGPPSIPDLTREMSGPSLSQRSLNSNGDVSAGLAHGRNRSGGIVSSSNVSDSMLSSPGKRLSGPSSTLSYSGTSRSEATARMRGGAGAAKALMAARARARGSGFLNHVGGGSGIGTAQASGSSLAVSSGDSIAPWDLPLLNMKGPRLHTSVDEAGYKSTTGRDSGQTDSFARSDSGSTTTASAVLKNRLSGVNRLGRRGSRGNGLADLVSSSSSSSLSGLTVAKSSGNFRDCSETLSSDPGHIQSSWKKRLEFAWGPRFLFPSNTARWNTKITAEQRQLPTALDVDEDEEHFTKSLTPLSFFCAALDKRWEAFETRSTSHTVGMNLLAKLASLQADEEMEEPVAKDVVAHLVESGHLLLYQRFRAAFVEPWVAAEVIETPGEDAVVNNRFRALQACMDLVHLLSYKRKFVFHQDECSVAKLYTEHTVFSMGAGAGADIVEIKQQVATNLDTLRLTVASEFYKEYAVHLRTLGFRHLRTLNTSRSCARGFPVAANENEMPGAGGFTEYFYHPERAAAEAGGWKMDPANSTHDVHPLSVVVLEVRCDICGVRVSAVLVSLNDLEQQDLRFQNRLAVKFGTNAMKTSGSRVQRVSSWLRAQLQTEALIYAFTIRYFQQHILQWIDASRSFHAGQNEHEHSAGKHPREDDALVATPALPWKNASTFQNIIKGLQCFLHAFSDPPDKSKIPSAAAPPMSSVSKSCVGNNTPGTGSSDPRSTSSDAHRSTSRAASRTSRQVVTTRHPQQPGSHLRTISSAPNTSVAPLSLVLHDCVIQVAVVTLRATSQQSNCSELVLVQILLRYIACHGSRYEVLDLLQFGTPDAVVCHSASGSFFHRPPCTTIPSSQSNEVKISGGYSLVITTQPLTLKPVDKDSVQLVLLKSTRATLDMGNEVLPVKRALQEATLFTRELFRVATQHYERDLLWSRLLFDDSHGPETHVAHTLALPADSFRVEVGPQQLEECLRLSICTPLKTLDPRLDELLRVSGVCWQELALRLRDIYTDQLREFQFEEEDENSSHLLLLCPDAFDLIIHLTFITPRDQRIFEQAVSTSGGESTDSQSSSIHGSHVSSTGRKQLSEGSFENETEGDVHVEICRREEPTNKQFTFAQRRSISEFVNSIVHWQWRSLIYD